MEAAGEDRRRQIGGGGGGPRRVGSGLSASALGRARTGACDDA